jgi:hypothetical protein
MTGAAWYDWLAAAVLVAAIVTGLYFGMFPAPKTEQEREYQAQRRRELRLTFSPGERWWGLASIIFIGSIWLISRF